MLTSELRKKINLEQGRKYKGYGLLNEYGEFEFIPENTGAHKGRRKLLKEGANYSVYTSREACTVRITVRKQSSMLGMINEFLSVCNIIINVLKTYEI